jgi:biotin carboxyl carrier protein
MKYEAIVNGKPAKLELSGAGVRYERETGEVVEREYSIAVTGSGQWSVLAGGRSYAARLLSNGEVSVNGRVFRVEIFDPRSRRGRQSAVGSEGPQNIVAPMPGRVIRVLIEAGQEVEDGQGLIVVEAMKMQNEMKSPRAGRVAEVKTAAGATVAAGEILAVIE